MIDGLTRRCGSQEGNALAVCCRLGLADDPRVQLLAESLVGWQWPDGGWNCDKKASGRRSSFNESLPPMWGLHEYWVATGEEAAREAALRTAELLLDHRIFRLGGTGEADQAVLRRDPLPAVLALRLLPGARRAGADGARERPARRRRARAPRGAPPPGRPLAVGQQVVASRPARRARTSRSSTGAAARAKC